MINNSKYVGHEKIHARLNRVYKLHPFDIDDVLEWCAEAEIDYMPVVDTMLRFLEVPLKVIYSSVAGIQPKVLLPCNVAKLWDVYSDPNTNGSDVEHFNEGAFLYLPLDYKLPYVYINYVGIPIDDNGNLLIVKGHEQACETFCKIKNFEEDALYGKFNAQMWYGFKEEFSGQIQYSKYSILRNMTRQDFNKLEIIRGNAVPKIGRVSLYHLNFK